MNKTEKIIVVLLGLVLAGWLWHSFDEQKKLAAQRAEQAAQAGSATNTVNGVSGSNGLNATNAVNGSNGPDAPKAADVPSVPKVSNAPQVPKVHTAPEQLVVLSNAEIAVTLTTRGAAVKSATLFGYAQNTGKIGPDNPPLTLDFSAAPALALQGFADLESDADYQVQDRGEDFVVFRHAAVTRRIALKEGFRLELSEEFAKSVPSAANQLSLGCMAMGSSKNDILSIDSMTAGTALEKPKALHHGDEEPLKSYLAGMAGGCGGKRSAEGIPEVSNVDVPGAQSWVAVKNRFFVTALARSSETNVGFRATMVRDMSHADYVLKSVAAAVAYPALAEKRTFTFYIGPKKQALLWDLGMRDVMEYGMWRWFCYPLVWTLNACHSAIPSYGIAIILLTILVRVLFWPLTHKSTVGMRKMQEIQAQGHSGEVQGQSAAAAAGNLAALSHREGQSHVELPADADPDSGVHRPVQRAAFVGRTALRVVPLDCRPLRARRPLRLLVPVWRPQYPADPDGGHDGPAERLDAKYGRQEPATHDDGDDAADDAGDVLFVPVRLVALLDTLAGLLHRTNVVDSQEVRHARAQDRCH